MDSLPLQLLVNVLLIAVNAFFAASEIAVISLNKTKLRFMAEDGDKTAKRLLKLAETPTGFLSTIQIAITLAGFLNSAFAADNFADRIVGWLYDDLQWQAIPRATLNTLAVIFVTIILCLIYQGFIGEISLNFMLFHFFIYIYLQENFDKILNVNKIINDIKYYKCLYLYYFH